MAKAAEDFLNNRNGGVVFGSPHDEYCGINYCRLKSSHSKQTMFLTKPE